MFATSLRRVIVNAFINFWRNGWVSVATILVMVLAIFTAGSLILFQVLLNSTLDEVSKKIDITVYFKLDAPEDEILRIEKMVSGLAEVESVQFVSSQQALEEFKRRHDDNALISSALDELGSNPLGANLRIQSKDPTNYSTISLFFDKQDFGVVDKINYQQNERIFTRLASVISVTRKVGLSVSLVLGAIAFLVAFNTIRLAIYTSRDEIGIMRLVGASTWYVRGPFLIEGVIHGFFASVVAMLTFWPLTLWLGPKARDFFGGVDLFEYYATNLFQFFFVLLLVGVVLGVLSSFIATRRYLKI